MKIRTASLPLTALLMIALAGCSISVSTAPETTDDTAEVTGGTPSEQQVSPAEDTDPAPQTLQGEESSAPEKTTDSNASVVAIACDGEHTVTGSASTITVNGDCDRLVLRTDAATVTAGAIGELEIVGEGNTISAARIETVTVTGDFNTVVWSAGSPAVTDSGNGNTIAGG